jgi:hypothetical protein
MGLDISRDEATELAGRCLCARINAETLTVGEASQVMADCEDAGMMPLRLSCGASMLDAVADYLGSCAVALVRHATMLDECAAAERAGL